MATDPGQTIAPSARHPDAIIATATHTENEISARILAEIKASDLDLFFSLLAEWVRSDPAAARFAESLPAGIWREDIIRRVSQGWAAQDPVGAEKWAAQLSDERERISTIFDFRFQVAQVDARHAVEIAQQHGLESAPGAVMEILVQQWAAKDHRHLVQGTYYPLQTPRNQIVPLTY